MILAALISSLILAQSSAPARGPACPLAGEDLAWTRKALAAWAWTRDQELRLTSPYDPVIVIVEANCAWRLDPRAVSAPGYTPLGVVLRAGQSRYRVTSAAHSGEVLLPDGDRTAARRTSFAAPMPDGGAFFVMAGPRLWAAGDRRADPRLALAVFAHEITHTQQQINLGKRIDALVARGIMPAEVDDDVVQKRFGKDPAFKAAVERETELLFAAAAAKSTSQAVKFAREAVTSIDRRRAVAYTTGAAMGEVEDLFLTMEGAGQWAGYRYLRASHGGAMGRAAALETIRGSARPWSQEEGLALFLALDRLSADWRGKIFGHEPVYAVDLLRRGLSRRP